MSTVFASPCLKCAWKYATDVKSRQQKYWEGGDGGWCLRMRMFEGEQFSQSWAVTWDFQQCGMGVCSGWSEALHIPHWWKSHVAAQIIFTIHEKFVSLIFKISKGILYCYQTFNKTNQSNILFIWINRDLSRWQWCHLVPGIFTWIPRYSTKLQNRWGTSRINAFFYIKNYMLCLTLSILMDSSFWFDTINLGWSIVYI